MMIGPGAGSWASCWTATRVHLRRFRYFAPAARRPYCFRSPSLNSGVSTTADSPTVQMTLPILEPHKTQSTSRHELEVLLVSSGSRPRAQHTFRFTFTLHPPIEGEDLEVATRRCIQDAKDFRGLLRLFVESQELRAHFEHYVHECRRFFGTQIPTELADLLSEWEALKRGPAA
jgi:hypothetical protein